MEPIRSLLTKPLKVGTTFDTWTIVETDVSVETPYKNLNMPLSLKKQEKTSSTVNILLKDLVKSKRESIMHIEDGEYIVTSTLKAVDQ